MLDDLVFVCKPAHEKLAWMSTIHEQIARARREKKWSMEQLAAEVSRAEGLSKPLTWQAVQQWENGTSAPKRKRLEVVATLLELPVTGLVATGRQGELAMGPGVDQHDDVVVGRLTLSPQWVTKTLKPSQIENLRFIHGYGDSMEPTFVDGDILLVDAGINAIKVDGIYVLEANDRLYIKRVRQRMDSSFEISSDNPNVKTVDVLDGSRPVRVHGRVVWVWNGKKL